MNIALCIKQVPGTTKVDIDEQTGVLKRDGVDSKMNPYDLFAIETAVRLREAHGGTVTALTMGPMQAQEIIKEAFAMGVDSGAILSDRAFAGSDVLATSRALSEALKSFGSFDLIICGKQTTDGDTAQVGPEIAEFLNIPHVANVTQIIDVTDTYVRLEMDLGNSVDIQDVSLPCLITVEKDIYVPRLPSYRLKVASAERAIRVITLKDLPNADKTLFGLNGSPTQVEKIFPPDATGGQKRLTGSADDIAEQLVASIKNAKLIG